MTWLIIPVAVYSVGIFALWLALRRMPDDPPPAAGAMPKVTVVVAARNEEKNISALLESLSHQDYTPDLLDIIIVNDNSTDRTPIVVSEFIEMHRQQSEIRMRFIYNPFSGKKRAIRYGIEKGTGELILTTDADCVVGPGWVSAHAAAYGPAGESAHAGAGRAGSDDMVLGEVYQRPAKGFVALFSMFEFSALQSITEAAVMAGHPVMCNAANMSFRREVYLMHAGELREELSSGDDMFLLHAVRRAGGRVGYTNVQNGSMAGHTIGSDAGRVGYVNSYAGGMAGHTNGDARGRVGNAGSGAAAETAGAVTAAALLRQRARWASKTFYYRDAATLTLAAATAACNAAVAAAAVASAISVANIPLLGALYGLRVVPDYLIIARNIKKRGGKVPLIQFVLSELVYPFYFMGVAVISLFPSSRRFGKR